MMVIQFNSIQFYLYSAKLQQLSSQGTYERWNDVQRPASKQTDQKDRGINLFLGTTEINI